jgi:peptidylprolyl isomerase
MAQRDARRAFGTGGSGKKLKAEFNREPMSTATVRWRAPAVRIRGQSIFICFDDASFLNNQYTVWGKVIEGMENVDKIKRGEPVRIPTRSSGDDGGVVVRPRGSVATVMAGPRKPAA